jgi:hypothetical protein
VHWLLVIAATIACVGAVYFFHPNGPAVRHVNKAAQKRNDEGRGNLMTRPIWGEDARRPRDDEERGNLMARPEDDVRGSRD